MLKLLDSSKNFVKHITNYKDLKLERQLENGDETLYFAYRGKQSDILNEQYIETDRQRYVVKEVRPTDSGVEYVCKLDLEALESNMLQQFTAKDQTCEAAARLALTGTGWTVVVDSSLSGKQRSVQQFKKTPLDILYKIRDAFMCEIWFDCTSETVHFDAEIGEDKGVYARPELNLVSLNPTFDSYDYYTRIIPIGADGLTIESVNDGKNYVENYQYSNKIRTLIWEDTSYENAQNLKDDAIGKLSDLSKPKRSYSAKIRDLAKISHQYDILAYDLGDTIHVTDEPKAVTDKQRIVKITEYPGAPEDNEIEISNTTLSWEELQAKIKAAADAWDDISNSDGTINGVYVHGIQADDVVGIEVVVNDGIESSATISAMQGNISTNTQNIATNTQNLQAITARVGTIETNYISAEQADIKYATITNLNATNAIVSNLSGDYATFKTTTTNELAAHQAIIDDLDATYLKAAVAEVQYAKIDLANIAAGTIKTAMIDTGAVQTAQIADGSITDAKIVTLTANKINAGTLSVDRLEIRGSTSSIVYALNDITGAMQAQNVNTLNGEILTPRTITADRIVANAITANEIAAHTITANQIAANSITASELNVSTLSAISANMGSITGGSLNIGNGNFVVTSTGALTATGATINGTLTAVAGSSIGPWTIGATAIYKTSATWGDATAGAAYFGNNGISITDKFKVDASGTITATTGAIGPWNLDSTGFEGTYQKIRSIYNFNYNKNITETWIDIDRWTILDLSNDFPMVDIRIDKTGSTRHAFIGISSEASAASYLHTIQLDGYNGDIDTEGGINASGIIKTDGGDIICSRTDANARITASCNDNQLILGVTLNSMGLWSTSYYISGAGWTSDPKWLIYRGPDGFARVYCYTGSGGTPVVSSSTDTNRVGAVFTPSASSFGVNGQWGGTTYAIKYATFSSSDIRLKTNIKPTTKSGLDVINRIPMCEFDWTDHAEHQDIGFIADYLEDLDPCLAVGGGYEEDGTMSVKSVETFRLQAYEVKAIQELSAQVKALQAQVEALKLA